MLRLRIFFRLVIVAHLFVASLVFPTLHFHLVGDHDHESDEIQRHGMVHAHFLVSLAGSDSRASGIHHEDRGYNEDGNEIGLVALTSHKLKNSNQPFQKQLFFLDDHQRHVFVATFFRALVGKPDSPPHLPKFQFLGSPRSPPSFL
jgi:hypothetical protein